MEKLVNQTKHAEELGNMANVYVSHVLCILYNQIRFISHMDNNTKLYPQQMNITLQN